MQRKYEWRGASAQAQPVKCRESIADGQLVVVFSSRRRHTRLQGDWSSDVCSSDLETIAGNAKPKQNQNQFIGDAHGIANIIRGNAKTQAPARDEDKGHMHLTGPEFWFILEGQMEIKMGSLATFVADQGDVVYAPAQTWHRPRFAGAGMAT